MQVFHKLKLHNLKYISDGDLYARVEIDGHRIKCSRFSFDNEVNSIPYAEIEIPVNVDIEAMAEVGLRVNIGDIDSAIRCLKMAYQLDNTFKEHASNYVRDALGDEVDAWDIAKRLLTDDNT